MTTITTTLFLPLLLLSPPRMVGPQQVNVLWVSTPRTAWQDTDDARLALAAALRWWEARAVVSFTTVEMTMTIDTDMLALNVCRERSWLPPAPPTPTLYMIATDGAALDCDGVAVGDYTIGTQAIVWGWLIRDSPTDQATLAHTLAHLYGAQDTHAHDGQPGSGDIMDRNVYVDAYRQGIIAASTWQAIGAVKR